MGLQWAVAAQKAGGQAHGSHLTLGDFLFLPPSFASLLSLPLISSKEYSRPVGEGTSATTEYGQ